MASGLTNIVWTPLGGSPINLAQSIDTAQVWIETKDIDLDREDVYKFLQKIYAQIDELGSAPGLSIYVKWRDQRNQTLSEVGPLFFNGNAAIPVRPPGAKFFRIRFEDNGVAVRWKLSEFEVFGAAGGRRFG